MMMNARIILPVRPAPERVVEPINLAAQDCRWLSGSTRKGKTMERGAAATAPGPIVAVAIEQHVPKNQRIIEDKFASSMLPLPMRAFVELTRVAFVRNWIFRVGEKSGPGIWGGVLCRKRYIDEMLIGAIGQIDAVVNLGAGFDTRAFRLPGLASTPVWEIDQQQNIETKRARLHKLFEDIPTRIKLVPVNFEREMLRDVLALHGYQEAGRTFFILEAVTQYLTGAGIHAIFEFLAGARPGSRLTFTYIRKDFIEGREMYGEERLYQRYVAGGRLWLFGIDPEGVAKFLEPYGWRVIEHCGYDELVERYIKVTGRALAFTSIERIVHAEKA